MSKEKTSVDKTIDKIFPEGQRKMIKKAIVDTVQVSPNLTASVLRIGNDTSVLLTGRDDNNNLHYTMMSKDTFNQLKKSVKL